MAKGVSVFFSSRRRHTRYWRDWSSDVCSSDLILSFLLLFGFFRKKKIVISLIPRKVSWTLIQKLFSIGFSSFVMEFAAAIVLVLFNIQFMKYGGEISVSAFCIVASTFYFFRMLFTG